MSRRRNIEAANREMVYRTLRERYGGWFCAREGCDGGGVEMVRVKQGKTRRLAAEDFILLCAEHRRDHIRDTHG